MVCICYSFSHLLVYSTSIYFALGTMLESRDSAVYRKKKKTDGFLFFLEFSIRHREKMFKNVEEGQHTGENADGLRTDTY